MILNSKVWLRCTNTFWGHCMYSRQNLGGKLEVLVYPSKRRLLSGKV